MGDISIHGDQIVISETFHSNFGDFALQSSDGPVFYFPKAILQYSSKVFATMFEVGTASPQDKPILIQADSQTLDLLLRLLHPALVNPPVHQVDMLANLLRLANQYDMEPTIHILKTYFTLPFTPTTTDSLITTEPLASLIVSYSYNYLEVARAALRAVVKSDLTEQIRISQGYDLPLFLLEKIYVTRQAYIDKYRKMIFEMYRVASSMYSLEENDLEILEDAVQDLMKDPTFAVVKRFHESMVDQERLDASTFRGEMIEWEQSAEFDENVIPDL